MIKMLVVDDEKGICRTISDYFTLKGYTVFTAVTPDEAVDIFDREKPQFVFLDVIMPQMSGLDLLKIIRDKDEKTKIIMVTVADDEQTKEIAFQRGADDFITKPFSVKYLEEIRQPFYDDLNY